jgi:recombination protein RecT
MANDTTAVARLNEGSLRQLLHENGKKLMAYLAADGVPLPRVAASVMLACNRNPDLYDCDPSSLIQATAQALRMGLDPSGTLGSAYLVPYRDKHRGMIAQMIPGYRGLIDLATSSGAVRMVEAEVIYEADTYEIEYGINPIFRHKPNYTTKDPGAPILFYCILTLPSGDRRPTVMTPSEIDAIRDRGPVKKMSPWISDYIEMAKKTVIRRALKTAALNPDRHINLAAVLHEEDSREIPGWEPKQLDDLFAARPVATRSDQLAEKLGAQLPPAQPQTATPSMTAVEADWVTVFRDHGWSPADALRVIRQHDLKSPDYAVVLTRLAEGGQK